MRAGVIESGKGFAPTEEGTPQGGVISPLLMSVALHGLEEEAGATHRTVKNLLGRSVHRSVGLEHEPLIESSSTTRTTPAVWHPQQLGDRLH